MTTQILAGYDGTAGGDDAIVLGAQLALGPPRADLTVAHVYTPYFAADYALPMPYPEEMRAEAQVLLDRAQERFNHLPQTLFVTSPAYSRAYGLHALADELDASLLVVGASHHDGLSRVLDGTVTEQVVHGSRCPVAIAPAGYAKSASTLRAVGVGYDGSPESRVALKQATDLALRFGGELRIVHAMDLAAPGYMSSGELATAIRDGARELLEGAVAQATDAGVGSVSSHVFDDRADVALRREAVDLDLMVLGSRNHGALRRLTLGSTSTRVLRQVHCPLVIVPRGAEVREQPSTPGRVPVQADA